MPTWKFKEERPEDEQIRQLGAGAQATGATGPAALGFAEHLVVIQDMIDAIRDDREVSFP